MKWSKTASSCSLTFPTSPRRAVLHPFTSEATATLIPAPPSHDKAVIQYLCVDDGPHAKVQSPHRCVPLCHLPSSLNRYLRLLHVRYCIISANAVTSVAITALAVAALPSLPSPPRHVGTACAATPLFSKDWPGSGALVGCERAHRTLVAETLVCAVPWGWREPVCARQPLESSCGEPHKYSASVRERLERNELARISKAVCSPFTAVLATPTEQQSVSTTARR